MDTPLRLKAKERDSLTSKLNVCLIQVAFLQSILFSFPCYSKTSGYRFWEGRPAVGSWNRFDIFCSAVKTVDYYYYYLIWPGRVCGSVVTTVWFSGFPIFRTDKPFLVLNRVTFWTFNSLWRLVMSGVHGPTCMVWYRQCFHRKIYHEFHVFEWMIFVWNWQIRVMRPLEASLYPANFPWVTFLIN